MSLTTKLMKAVDRALDPEGPLPVIAPEPDYDPVFVREHLANFKPGDLSEVRKLQDAINRITNSPAWRGSPETIAKRNYHQQFEAAGERVLSGKGIPAVRPRSEFLATAIEESQYLKKALGDIVARSPSACDPIISAAIAHLRKATVEFPRWLGRERGAEAARYTKSQISYLERRMGGKSDPRSLLRDIVPNL